MVDWFIWHGIAVLTFILIGFGMGYYSCLLMNTEKFGSFKKVLEKDFY
jgi:hypothetical protein